MKRFKYIVGWLVLILVIYLAPVGVGLDWSLFHRFLNTWLQGGELYTVLDGWAIYAYSPWTTLVLLPLTLLNQKLGFAILSSLSIVSILLWAKIYHWHYAKVIAVLISPPVLYVLHLGQIDLAFAALPLIAPKELWPLMAGLKPQALLGYGFGFFRYRQAWKIGIPLTLIVVFLSFVFFGNWPLKVIELSQWSVQAANFNLTRHIWPYSIAIAVLFVGIGFKYDDMRWFMLASPFFLPYGTLVNFAGFTLALASMIRTRYIILIVTVAWLLMLKLAGVF